MERENFKSRLGFILISAGCAIGIGNVWKFPYVTGQNGGGIFVLFYLFFLIAVGVPVLTMEFAVGRASRKSPVCCYQELEKPGSKWHLHGYVAMFGNYVLMMFYTSVAGWMLSYFFKFLKNDFAGMNTEAVAGEFSKMLGDPVSMTFWMAVIVAVGFFICSMGLHLFPDYADPGMLRAVDYASYLRLFVETVRPEILSYDYYPFLGRDRSLSADKLFLVETERERGIRQAAARMEDRTEFFRNLGAIREAGLEAGIPTMLILQLTEHGYYRNPTKEELLWQVTHALAYGVSRISYFTYWLPDSDDGFWLWDNAMVERDGSPNPHYHQVREINRRLRSLGKALEGRTSEAVFHADPAEPCGLPLRPHGALRSLRLLGNICSFG